MARSRRSVLAAVTAAASSALAGCVGEAPPETTPTSERVSTQSTQPTTSQPPCSTDGPAFEVPAVSKPDPLTAESVLDPVFAVEEAYEASISLTPDALLGIPDDATNLSFSLQRVNSDVVGAGDEFEVTVGAMARYRTGGDAGTTATSTTGGRDESTTTTTTTSSVAQYDRPMDAATYRVTERRIERTSGIGDLTGTVVCW
jgi:hypothetical protein